MKLRPFDSDDATLEVLAAQGLFLMCERSAAVLECHHHHRPRHTVGLTFNYIIRCSSAGNYSQRRPQSSHSFTLPPSEPSSPKPDDDCSNLPAAELYKQMTGNHLDLLEYASANLSKFFRQRDLVVSRAALRTYLFTQTPLPNSVH
ncbi:unnamed protein product [Gongylonema pulchrum]|uniref:RGS domain-containing protein n=1 Tax=Gongylonema pulchrum TaxID=637853 RepID=A0A183EMM2_9BILA|nr:unnamed protein product [Gongylonema pulchrum]